MRIAGALFAAILAAAAVVRADDASPQRAARPKSPVTVAFVVTPGANVMDFAGPWETFQDAMVPELGSTMDQQMPYRLYSVSDSTKPVEMSGGARIVPDHAFSEAPNPNIIVVGAQKGSPGMLAWLKRLSEHAIVMSVCTGAFQLGRAGLLDGHPATTHHDFFDAFQKAFPRVRLVRGRRWVQSSERVYTAGGLTSGIDLALHIVAVQFGEDAARRTAEYMEHAGEGWKVPTETPVEAKP